jgi:hypothetical protein
MIRVTYSARSLRVFASTARRAARLDGYLDAS